MATIFSIVYQPKDREYEDQEGDAFFREPLSKATLVANHGIEGDRKAGHQINRQLNILSWEWLASIKDLGYATKPGEFGEQIIIKDLDVNALEQGSRLQIGSTAVIEIVRPRTGCSRLEAAQGRSNEAFGGLVGQMARVLTGGEIQEGDSITLL